MITTFTTDISTEEAKQALSVFETRLPHLAVRTGICWSPYYGSPIRYTILCTIKFCTAILKSNAVPNEIRAEVTTIKLQYEHLLAQFEKANQLTS